MLINKEEQLKYLFAFKEGKIKKGLEIGNELDKWFVHKPKGSFTVVVGMDNVGKTNFMLWYFLCLSVKHNVKWCIWSGENSAGQITRDLIQMYAQQKLNLLLIVQHLTKHTQPVSYTHLTLPTKRIV